MQDRMGSAIAGAMRNRRKGFATAAEVLGRQAGNLRISEGMRLYRLWDLWPGIVGESLAEHARPARWQGRNLVVRVEHSAWMQELSFLKHTLKEKIDEAFPEAKVRGIRFEIGKLPESPKGATKSMPRTARDLSADELEFVEQAVGEIGDDETRDAARLAMVKDFQS